MLTALLFALITLVAVAVVTLARTVRQLVRAVAVLTALIDRIEKEHTRSTTPG